MGHGAWGIAGSPRSIVLSQTYALDQMLAESIFPTSYAPCPMPHAPCPETVVFHHKSGKAHSYNLCFPVLQLDIMFEDKLTNEITCT